MNNNLYLEFHVLQTVPPSCLNRDDTGSPKTALYGGTLRARVSSQAWKKAMRERFAQEFGKENMGYRTKNIRNLIQKELEKINSELEEKKREEIIDKILKIEKLNKDVFFFVSAKQIENVAKIAYEYYQEVDSLKKDEKKEKELKKQLDAAMCETPSVDIMLFGRMAAANTNLNFDAAAQVAHAISTHTVSNEYDFFTVCDDAKSEDSNITGHLDTIEFNSSTLYRYATVNLGELFYKDGLSEEEVVDIVKGFANSFVKSMPTGKQNTFANRTLPYFIYAAVRKDQPINLVGAFEKPIMRSEAGYANDSEKVFIKEAKIVYENYGVEPEYAFVVGANESYDIGKKVKYNELVEQLMTVVSGELRKED